MLGTVWNDKFVCGCCGEEKSEKDRSNNSYRENNSVVTKWICKQCNVMTGELAEAMINSIKIVKTNSKNR